MYSLRITALGSTRLTSKKSRSCRLACVSSGPTLLPSSKKRWHIAQCFLYSAWPAAGLPGPARRSVLRRRIPGRFASVVTETAHFGQLFLRRAALHTAPVLADQGVESLILVQRDESEMLHRNILGCELPLIHRLEKVKGPALATEQHIDSSRPERVAHCGKAPDQLAGVLRLIEALDCGEGCYL